MVFRRAELTMDESTVAQLARGIKGIPFERFGSAALVSTSPCVNVRTHAHTPSAAYHFFHLPTPPLRCLLLAKNEQARLKQTRTLINSLHQRSATFSSTVLAH
ncbi:hypothetical protein LSTR_LSTR015822 [Laodelphax striatellus]|uniref:Uncharacterized protein n=1 Tax=Laodelphax striatellus TaxID=195883 RepID=A0A482XJ87_LAOST|nr:hypothetical protein LSTR_LSTR005810 [Laodelphax striatellus]RZF45976.1 hypothetical protein LSTR_LSTR015822 [Laodelphax striatellus]